MSVAGSEKYTDWVTLKMVRSRLSILTVCIERFVMVVERFVIVELSDSISFLI